MNEVFQTMEFKELLDCCDSDELMWVEKVKNQLKLNLNVGKPLRFSWFREKKLKNKRLFFVAGGNVALFVAFAVKKHQSLIIQRVIMNKEYYISVLKNLNERVQSGQP